MSRITYMQAVRDTIAEEMRKDEKLFMIGEDVGPYGGEMGLSQGLWKEFGEQRVKDFPISEATIVGTGVGAALVGARAIVEIPFCDFIGVAMDQLYNQAAKMNYMFGGKAKIPLVVRTPMGGYQSGAAQHSQCLEAWLCHAPGLQVVLPADAYDAKGLLRTALRQNSPVVFIEHKKLYQKKCEVPDEYYEVPFGKMKKVAEGDDLCIVATSYMVELAKQAAAKLLEKGIHAEILDPRTLVPFDEEGLLASVRKTGRLLIVQEAWRRAGFASEIASIAAEKAFGNLKAPVAIVAAENVPIPFSPVLEEYVLPNVDKITSGALRLMEG